MATPDPAFFANGKPPLRGARISAGRHALTAARIVLVRLRFPAVLVVAFLVVGKWDALRNYWDKLTRIRRQAVETVSPGIEYWCPMCPGVVSDWPAKCPVCNMTLVQRKRGEAVPLPEGVVARMQLSPYRVQLAGIQTSAIGYRPLCREVVLVGLADCDNPRPAQQAAASATGSEAPGPARVVVKAEVFDKDVPFLKPGRKVEVSAEAFPGHAPWEGKVRALTSDLDGGRPSLRVVLEVDDPGKELRAGMLVTARVQAPAAEVEPFRSLPTSAPPLRSGEPRRAFLCPDHQEVLRDQPGRCPLDQNELVSRPLADNQRLGWWCPMHPRVTADRPGCACAECQGMRLVPRIITYSPPGAVLAVPESAVLDTGSKRVVYLERGPGMFEGVEVVLGVRCGDSYPVIRGLEAGQRVATAGAFLIDAETRLNPGVAAGYFGAAQGSGAAPDPHDPAASPRPDGLPHLPVLLRLPAEDQPLAIKQKLCPVTGKPLGSMGVPTRVVVEGRTVFLCCEGCEDRLRGNPGKYLSKLPGK
jgi:hypothetical protein